MGAHRSVPGSASDWLSRARGDLAIARMPLPEGAFLEDLCYHAQQAAEKAVKAVYVHLNAPFRYTHDIAELLHGLNSQGLNVPDMVLKAASLTVFAWQTRYPGPSEPVTPEEHEQAVQAAAGVVEWAEMQIRAPD